jgi:hypothetical protein
VPIEAVVADANVLLSAVVGKAALRVFTEYGVTVHATEFNASEVEEYLPRLSAKYGLPPDLVQLQWRLLPIVRHAEAEYSGRLPAARERLRERDLERPGLRRHGRRVVLHRGPAARPRAVIGGRGHLSARHGGGAPAQRTDVRP